MIRRAALGENTNFNKKPGLSRVFCGSQLLHLYLFLLLVKAFGSDHACRTQLDRVMQRTVGFAGLVHTAIVDQPMLLQVFKGIGYRMLPPVVIQNFLAETGWVGVEQTGENFFFQCVIDGHIYLALLVS
jgi:hypothetical protein